MKAFFGFDCRFHTPHERGEGCGCIPSWLFFIKALSKIPQQTLWLSAQSMFHFLSTIREQFLGIDDFLLPALPYEGPG
jgi:hypothetical protein